MANPTAREQLTLEYINLLRTDPGGEYDRLVGVQSNIDNAVNFFGVDLAALESQLDAIDPTYALAWNSAINEVATTHSQGMIDFDMQSHNLPGEASLGSRLADAGYANRRAWAENIFAFTQDDLYGHAGFVIDWGYDDDDFVNGQLRPDWQTNGDGIQDPAGHRIAMVSTTYTEIGIGILAENDPATSVGPFVVTQNFATRFDYEAQFVGVVTDDADGDDFYDIGEGLGGVTVTLTDAGGQTFDTMTWNSGGWQIEVAAGTYTIEFSGGGLDGTVTKTATLGSDNVKVDAQADEAVAGGVTVSGTAGRDRLDGGAGDDHLIGLSGDDRLFGSAGSDSLDGGAGRDTVLYTASTEGLTVDLQAAALNDGIAAGDTYADIEDLAGSGHFDELRGNGEDNRLFGLAGNDILFGRDGDDDLRGGSGGDRLFGGDGADILRGGRGTDWAAYLDSNAAGVTVDLQRDAFNSGTAAGDRFESIENVLGSNFADSLRGDGTDNRLDGKDGDDALIGRGGEDVLSGGGGSDALIGGRGADLLVGGGGRDTFRFFGADEGGDTILDFRSNVDRILLGGSDFDAVDGGVTAGNFVNGGAALDADDHLLYDGANRLWFDADGDGSEGRLLIATLSNGTALDHEDFLVV